MLQKLPSKHPKHVSSNVQKRSKYFRVKKEEEEEEEEEEERKKERKKEISNKLVFLKHGSFKGQKRTEQKRTDQAINTPLILY